MAFQMITLYRFSTTIEHGTFGVISVDETGIPLCVTLEPPWMNNRRDVSCIPAGNYTIMKIKSERFGATWAVMNVPGRGGIIFHRGNSLADTKGCILVGSSFGGVGSTRKIQGIRASNAAMARFLARTSGVHTMTLEIRWC